MARRNPIRDEINEALEELKKIFDEEAWKYNVYPLYDDMIKRLAKQQDRLFGDQKEFVYYAPGAVRIAEKASAPVKNRSHDIVTTVDLAGDEEDLAFVEAVYGELGASPAWGVDDVLELLAAKPEIITRTAINTVISFACNDCVISCLSCQVIISSSATGRLTNFLRAQQR